jgi:hypothetical protein
MPFVLYPSVGLDARGLVKMLVVFYTHNRYKRKKIFNVMLHMDQASSVTFNMLSFRGFQYNTAQPHALKDVCLSIAICNVHPGNFVA